jgi:hypothetical protein
MKKDFDIKKEMALAILAKSRISSKNYLPPIYPFLWKWNVEIRPPHFMVFWKVLLFTGLPYGFCWIGLAMMDHNWALENLGTFAFIFILVTLVCGGFIANYYKVSSTKNKIPKWEALKS